MPELLSEINNDLVAEQEDIRVADQVTVQEACIEDRRVIWEWWNDPTTRKMMKKNDTVGWEEHCAWFEGVLKDQDRVLCVGRVGDQGIGNVRFDRQADGVYEVSINLKPEFRGMGYGAWVLKESIHYLIKVQDAALLFSMLKKENIPSKRTFEKAGFVFIENPQYDYEGCKEFEPETELFCELNMKGSP